MISVLLIVLSVILIKLILPIFLLFNSVLCVKCILMCFTIVISFNRPSVFLLVFSMGNRKCTAWLSSLTVLCYLCIGTCVFHGKLQYIHIHTYNKLLVIIISNSLHLIAKAREWLQNYVAVAAFPEVSHEK